MKILKSDNTKCVLQDFHGGGQATPLVCCRDKIDVPAQLQKHVNMWYHPTLCHPGINRTKETIGQHVWWPKMRDYITNYVKICPLCQHSSKIRQQKYGLVPPKEAEATPFHWSRLPKDNKGSLCSESKTNHSNKSPSKCYCRKSTSSNRKHYS